MKFFVFAAAILALSTASTLFRGGKTISVNDDGTILVTDVTGKQIIITRPLGLNKNIELSVVGPNIPRQSIEIDDILTGNVGGRVGIRDLSQSQILADILKENQGLLDEPSYGLLLQRLDQAVKDGQISSTIYSLLENLDVPVDVLLSKLNQQIPMTGQQGLLGQRMLPINRTPITPSSLVQNLPIDMWNMMMRRTPMENQWTNSQRIVGLGINENQIGQQMPVVENEVNKLPQTWMERQQMIVPGVDQLVSGIRGIDIRQLIGSGINQNQVPQSWLDRQQMVVPGVGQLVSGIRENNIGQLIGSGINQNQVSRNWLIGQQMQVPLSGIQVVPQRLRPIVQGWTNNQLPPLVQQQPIRSIWGNINQLPVLQQQWQPTQQQLDNILMGKLRQVQTLGGGFIQGLGANQQRSFLQNEPIVNMMEVPQIVLN